MRCPVCFSDNIVEASSDSVGFDGLFECGDCHCGGSPEDFGSEYDFDEMDSWTGGFFD